MDSEGNIKNLKSSKYVLIITICSVVFLSLLAVFSYAFFANEANIQNDLALNFTIEEGLTANFTATGSQDIIMDVPGENMLLGSVGEVAGTADTSITLTLQSKYDVECTYELAWIWDIGSPNQYTKTEIDANEFTILGSDGKKSLAEVQLPSYGVSLVLGTYNIKTFSSTTTKTWNFTSKFYNVDANQDSHADAIYKGKIVVQNAQCERYVPTLSEVVIALADGSDRTSATNGSVYRVIDQNGVRYEGANPDNYVNYNDEEWRIIGVFDGSDIGLQEGEKYTKIIKLQTIGSYYWDAEDSNGDGTVDTSESDWTNATLKILLNNDYLNSDGDFVSSGINDVARQMIAKSNDNYPLWHLRIGGNSSSTADQMYEYERVTGTPGYRNGVSGDADPATRAAIGLMYVSDYGYATYAGINNSSCLNTTLGVGSITTDCVVYNWIYYSRFSMNNHIGYYIPMANNTIINAQGRFGSFGGFHKYKSATFPVIYLDSSVKVIGGTGQKGANAYQLSK
ncbi:MAG: hypothetical protein E7167_05655 [Firmicutes bacterium]|nr:hypothetical protein [Bacillota bacterium]